MKKVIALILSLIMCFTLATAASAADETRLSEDEVTIEIDEADTEITDKAMPEGDSEEVKKIISVLTEVVSYVYNFATQPEEPAVDLETVLTVVQVAVYIVYGIVQYCQSNK